MRTTIALALCLATSLSFGQARLAGKGQYPQSRTISGLAGGGTSVLPNGRPSIRGALTLSTPIGYTLGKDSAVLTGGTTSLDSNLRWFDGDVTTNGSNGTAAILFGVDTGRGNLGVSLVQTSRLSEDRVVNLQFSPKKRGPIGVSVGVQDLLDETVTTPNYGESAQTYFIATTYQSEQAYFTVGAGTKRFRDGFASASAPLGSFARAMVEHDGYGLNYGVELQLFDVKTSRASLFLGSCQTRYATWALSWQF